MLLTVVQPLSVQAFARAASVRAMSTSARRVAPSLLSRFARPAGVAGTAVGAAAYMSAAPAEAADAFTDPDQQRRFANAKAAGNQRVLDIDKFYDPSKIKSKRVLITGGNRGLGLALTKQLVADGAVVTVTCRKTTPELDALGVDKIVTGIDVTDDKSMDKLVGDLKGQTYDIVINNAGYFWEPLETLDNLNFQEEMKMIDICALGPLRVSAALVKGGLLKEGAKIAMITSQGGSISWRDVQNPEGHDYGHHMSKAAANMMSKLLSQELKAKGIAVLILHPGFNKTEMTKKYEEVWEVEGAVDPQVGAKRVLHEISIGTMDTTGRFINCEDGLQIPF